MITIAPGIVPPIARGTWWEGKEAVCPKCSVRVKLERSDETSGLLNSHSERHPGGKQWVDFTCPTPDCREQVKLERVKPALGEAAEFARNQPTPLA